MVRFVADTMAVSTALEAGEADVSYSVRCRNWSGCGRTRVLTVTTASDDYLNNAQVLEFNLDRPVLARRESATPSPLPSTADHHHRHDLLRPRGSRRLDDPGGAQGL